MDGERLINRYGLEDFDWIVDSETTDDYFYIHIKNTIEMLTLSSNGTVNLEDFKKGKSQQLWKKVLSYGSDAKGYFLLMNHENEKDILTATKSWLEMRGDITHCLDWDLDDQKTRPYS